MIPGIIGVTSGAVESEVSFPSDYVARYLFTSFPGGVAADETGNYDGTVTSATVTTGPGGADSAADLGSGKYITLPNGLITALGSGAGTVSCAIRPKSNSGHVRIISASDTAGVVDYLAYRLKTSTLEPDGVFNGPNTYTASDSATLNTWAHLIIRTSGSATTFRLDGVNLTTSEDSGSDTGAWFDDVAGPDKFLVGRFERTTASDSEDFELGYLTLYDRSISDSECVQLESEY